MESSHVCSEASPLKLSEAATASAIYSADYGLDYSAGDGLYDYGYGSNEVGFYDDGEWKTEDASEVEYDVGEGYDEEEWYDPTDWFDVGTGVSDDNSFGYDYSTYTDDYGHGYNWWDW
jgi:hypothetical protein